MKYGVKLVEYKGQPVELWLHVGKGQVIADSFEEAEKVAKSFSERNPGGLYRVMVIPETDPNGDEVLEDVFSPTGFRYKDGSHSRAVHSEREAELALAEPVEPCPSWCSCKKRKKFWDSSSRNEYHRQ